MSEPGLVAWWGAGLSTALGLLTVYDRFLRKPLPTVTYSFSSSEEMGNVIMLANPNATPIMIEYWKLFWAKPQGLRLVETLLVASPDGEDLTTWTIAPYNWQSLSFREGHHFGWTGAMLKNGSLYLEVHIVNRRRPVSLHIYPGDEPLTPRRLLPHAFRPKPVGEFKPSMPDDPRIEPTEAQHR